MTFEEKLKRIKRNDEKNYLLISPSVIEPVGSLVESDETFKSEKALEDTPTFANYYCEEVITYEDLKTQKLELTKQTKVIK